MSSCGISIIRPNINFTNFIIRNVPRDTSLKDINLVLSRLQIKTKFSCEFEFADSKNQCFMIYSNSNEKKIIESLKGNIHDLQLKFIPSISINPKEKETLFSTGFPSNFSVEDLTTFISAFDPTAEITYKHTCACIIPTTVFTNNLIRIFLPGYFEGSFITSDCFNLPLLDFMGYNDSMTENQFCEKFNADRVSFIGNNHAVALYSSLEIADAKLNQFNYLDDEIFVEHYLPDVIIQTLDEWELRCYNIVPSWGNKELRKYFMQFGRLIQSFIFESSTGSRLASIRFYRDTEAHRAYAETAGQLSQLQVCYKKDLTVVIYNFKTNITEEKILSIFTEVEQVSIVRSDRARPTVFVAFETEIATQNWMERARTFTSGGLRLMALSPMGKDRRTAVLREISEKFCRYNCLCIRGLPEWYTQEDFIALCSPFGEMRIAYVYTLNNPPGAIAGVVSFANRESYDDALESLRGEKVEGHRLLASKYEPPGFKHNNQRRGKKRGRSK